MGKRAGKEVCPCLGAKSGMAPEEAVGRGTRVAVLTPHLQRAYTIGHPVYPRTSMTQQTLTAILSALAEEQHGLNALLQEPRWVQRAGREFWGGSTAGKPGGVGVSSTGWETGGTGNWSIGGGGSAHGNWSGGASHNKW